MLVHFHMNFAAPGFLVSQVVEPKSIRWVAFVDRVPDSQLRVAHLPNENSPLAVGLYVLANLVKLLLVDHFLVERRAPVGLDVLPHLVELPLVDHFLVERRAPVGLDVLPHLVELPLVDHFLVERLAPVGLDVLHVLGVPLVDHFLVECRVPVGLDVLHSLVVLLVVPLVELLQRYQHQHLHETPPFLVSCTVVPLFGVLRLVRAKGGSQSHLKH